MEFVKASEHKDKLLEYDRTRYDMLIVMYYNYMHNLY